MITVDQFALLYSFSDRDRYSVNKTYKETKKSVSEWHKELQSKYIYNFVEEKQEETEVKEVKQRKNKDI